MEGTSILCRNEADADRQGTMWSSLDRSTASVSCAPCPRPLPQASLCADTEIADFLRRFGVPTTATEVGYAIPPDWQSALSNGSSAGGIIGLLVSRARFHSVTYA